jgi:hypothetical protein
MKKKRFSVEEIVAVLKQEELGVPVAEVIRKVGISEQTFYRLGRWVGCCLTNYWRTSVLIIWHSMLDLGGGVRRFL